jgi:ClpP class serine protease
MHLLDRVVNTPLLLTPAKAATIHEVLSSPEHLSAAAQFADYGRDDEEPRQDPPEGLAVIDISGTLVARGCGSLDALSGLRSYESIRADLAEAMADPGVKRIVLRVDSPGGEAAGAFDLADEIRAASAKKTIVAIAADQACSAAYLLASAAEKLYTTQTGVLGSIGVVLLHCDRMAQDVARGLRYTEVTSGARKADGNPHAALQGGAYAAIQAEVDTLAALFFSKVAAFRGLSLQSIQDLQAGVLLGQTAVDAGLADGITTLAALTAARGEEDRMTKDEKKPMAAEAPAPAPAMAAVPAAPVVDVEKIRADAIAAGRVEGAKLERERLSAIDAIAFDLASPLVAKAKADGMSAEAFAVEQCKAEKAKGSKHLETLAATEAEMAKAKPFAVAPSSTGKPSLVLPDRLDATSTAEQIAHVYATVPAAQEHTSIASFTAFVQDEGFALTKKEA